MIKVLDKEFADKKELFDYIQSLKNYDLVEYGGSESWKDNRSFVNFKLTYRDLHITKKHFNDLIHILEHQVWPFCDTIFLNDMAEDNEHILDWCFHGERMGWQEGDEMWLVYNLGRDRLEIRKADPDKWSPLDRYVLNSDRELRFKIGYLVYREDGPFQLDADGAVTKYVQDIGVNSFPDRIEISIRRNKTDEELASIHQVFDYYTKKSGGRDDIVDVFSPSYVFLKKAITENITGFDMMRYYRLSRKDEKEDMRRVYDDVLKYSHQLKYYQMLDKPLTDEELDTKEATE